MTMPVCSDLMIGLGSNLGGRESLLRAAIAMIAMRVDGTLVGVSSVRETEPIGPVQPRYLNAAVHLKTAHDASWWLEQCLAIERSLGRVRDGASRWMARTMDLDILWADGLVLQTETLCVPHPHLCERSFALDPVLDLLPGAVDPRTGQPLRFVDSGIPQARFRTIPWRECFETVRLEHTADEGFEVWGLDRADLLAAAAEAMSSIVVDPSTVRATTVVEIEVEAPQEHDERLFSWLGEVLFHIDAHSFAVHRAVVLSDGPTHVRGVLLGEPLDAERHTIGSAIKAVTYHDMCVQPGNDQWMARVVIDV